MFISTPSGVLESPNPGALIAFGTADAAAETILLEPHEATVEHDRGPLVGVLGILLAAAQEVLLEDRSWRAAGSLAEGDAILHWTQGEGVMEPYVLPAPDTSQGDGLRVAAPCGALVGASATGPWILVR